MNFKHDISKTEKAFLLAHKYDYLPEIRQFILINEGNWLYDLKDEPQERMKIFRYTTFRNDFDEPFKSSVKKLFFHPVGEDITDFIKVMNKEVNDISGILSSHPNTYYKYMNYLRYVLTYIYEKKIEAILILEHVRDGGTPFFRMVGGHVSFISPIIEESDNLAELQLKFRYDEDTNDDYAVNIARNIVLLFRSQLSKIGGKDLSYIESVKLIYSYIASTCGNAFLEKVKSHVYKMISDEYLPVVSNKPIQTDIHDFDKIDIKWVMDSSDITSESSRSLTMFGATINGEPLSRNSGLFIMGIDDSLIKEYVKTESVDFELSSNELCFLRNKYRDNGMIILKNPKESRHIFNVVVENEESPFLLFKTKEFPDKVYGISCKTYKNHKKRYVFETTVDGDYELVYGKVLDND